MAQKAWEISGDYMESCNCDYLCPCIFTNPQGEATHEHCTALMVYRIERGRHGDVRLDGLKFALVIRSRRIMSEGGWVFGCVVDESASEAQRKALGDIVAGKAGGPPQMIRDNLVSDFRGIEFRRIEFTADGLRRATEIPGILAFAIEGVASRRQPDLGHRAAVLAVLGSLVALSWLYLLDEAHVMAAMDPDMVMPAKDVRELLLLLVMWWVMMVGMMLPGAAPMILTFATINANKRARGQSYTPTALFASGYLLAWAGFSVAATLLQAGLERASLLAPMTMKTTSPLLGGVLFITAGLYQLTPLKQACLSHCRSPFDFILNHWREGTAGAVRMGWTHGLYCLGCCWILMALLFVGGVMNLAWVALLTFIVLAEKLFPAGPWIARATGGLSIGYGVWLLAFS